MSQAASCPPTPTTTHLSHQLLLIWIITVAFGLLECLGAWWSGSLILWADAGHMFTDSLSILLAWLGQVLQRYPAPERYTFGWRRIELLAGLCNGGLLLLIAIGLLQTAWQQWHTAATHVINIDIMLPIAAVGFVANLWCMRLLHPHGHHLSVQGAIWHLLADAFSSLLVLLAALIVAYTGWAALDTLLTFPIALLLLFGSYQLFKQTVPMLLLAAPAKLAPNALRQQLAQIEGVAEVADLHCWQLTSEAWVLTATIVAKPQVEPFELLSRCQACLRLHTGSGHCTIQIQSSSLP